MSDWWVLLIVALPLILLELAAVGEVLLGRADLSAARRVAWCVALLAVPYLPLLAYVIVRPTRRSRALVRPAGRREPRARAFVVAVERHVRGELDDAAYRQALVAAAEAPAVDECWSRPLRNEPKESCDDRPVRDLDR